MTSHSNLTATEGVIVKAAATVLAFIGFVNWTVNGTSSGSVLSPR